MWLYKLLKHKNGLTASELAAESMIDRSLISRELAGLAEDGYITIDSQGKKRGYNSRIKLTEKGRQIADVIAKTAYEAQCAIGEGVSDEDLVVFYRTLEKLCSNFEKLEKEEKEIVK
jgi:DNA-binding MarR family transcriptional regulator